MISQTEVVSSKDNPNIRRYQRLAAQKKERFAYGLFVLEGVRLVQDALREHAALEVLMLTVAAAEKYAALFSQADLKETKQLIISNELGTKIAETQQTQGVFAICHMLPQTDFAAQLHTGGTYLLLHQLQDPGNVGMILRTADALGIDGVVLSECCDLYSPKVIRATMGSVFRVPFWCGIPALTALTQLHTAGIPSFAAVIDPAAVALQQCDFSQGAAVCIGNEGNGLPADVAAACDMQMTIQMQGHINSLNAAMATGIILWELKRGNRKGADLA